jgi:hypothetical protein
MACRFDPQLESRNSVVSGSVGRLVVGVGISSSLASRGDSWVNAVDITWDAVTQPDSVAMVAFAGKQHGLTGRGETPATTHPLLGNNEERGLPSELLALAREIEGQLVERPSDDALLILAASSATICD